MRPLLCSGDVWSSWIEWMGRRGPQTAATIEATSANRQNASEKGATVERLWVASQPIEMRRKARFAKSKKAHESLVTHCTTGLASIFGFLLLLLTIRFHVGVYAFFPHFYLGAPGYQISTLHPQGHDKHSRPAPTQASPERSVEARMIYDEISSRGRDVIPTGGRANGWRVGMHKKLTATGGTPAKATHLPGSPSHVCGHL